MKLRIPLIVSLVAPLLLLHSIATPVYAGELNIGTPHVKRSQIPKSTSAATLTNPFRGGKDVYASSHVKQRFNYRRQVRKHEQNLVKWRAKQQRAALKLREKIEKERWRKAQALAKNRESQPTHHTEHEREPSVESEATPSERSNDSIQESRTIRNGTEVGRSKKPPTFMQRLKWTLFG